MNNTENLDSILAGSIIELNGIPCATAHKTACLLGYTPGSLAVRRCKDPDSLPFLKSGAQVYYPISAIKQYAEDRKIMIHTGADQASDQAPEGALFLTGNQLAARWQCSLSKIHQLRRDDNRFPRPMSFGHRNRWALIDIESYEQQLKTEGNAA